jgi:hypothetical protein
MNKSEVRVQSSEFRLEKIEVRLEKTEVRLTKPVPYLFVFFLSVFCSLSSPVYSLTSVFCPLGV